MENPIKMDDLGVPLFLETPISEFHEFKMHVLSCPQILPISDKDGGSKEKLKFCGRHSNMHQMQQRFATNMVPLLLMIRVATSHNKLLY